MYGMVNKAVQELIVTEHGEETWQRIRTQAGVKDEVFISTQAYDDAVTYQLVAAASEVLGVPPSTVLKQFGRWWVLNTARQGYGQLLKAGGRTLGEFLQNLPNFHTRIVMMFPNLRPPEFECEDITPSSLRLHYHSHRKGLANFVIGLLDGLGEMFGVTVSISHEEQVDTGASHDVFHIQWSDPTTA